MTLATTSSTDALPAVLQSAVIGGRKQELATLESEYRRLAQTFKADYPRMQQLAEKITETRQQVRVESERVVAALHTDYQAAPPTARRSRSSPTRRSRRSSPRPSEISAPACSTRRRTIHRRRSSSRHRIPRTVRRRW